MSFKRKNNSRIKMCNKGLPKNFAYNIERIQANQLTTITPENIRKPWYQGNFVKLLLKKFQYATIQQFWITISKICYNSQKAGANMSSSRNFFLKFWRIWEGMN